MRTCLSPQVNRRVNSLLKSTAYRSICVQPFRYGATLPSNRLFSNATLCTKFKQIDNRIRTKFSVRPLSTYPSHKVVPMPALSPTMETGSIARWTLKEGDRFEAGTAICEVETDKTTVTYEATEEGYLAKILVGTGEVKVGQPLMITVDEQGDVAAFSSYVFSGASSISPSSAAPSPPTPTAPAHSSTLPTTPAPPASSPVSFGAAPGTRIIASPYARKLAREAGVPIDTIPGTGPNGRVVANDVLLAQKTGIKTTVGTVNLQTTSEASVAATVPVAAPRVRAGGIPGVYQDFELSDLALAVSARQAWAKQNVPHYYLSIDLNLDKLLKLRDMLNKSISAGGKDDPEVKLSVLDFFVKASALAMKKVPDANGAWMETFVRRYNKVDVNVVMESMQGLVTPLIKDAGSSGLKHIAMELAEAERSVSAGQLDKLHPGTFSIHDLGQYGVKSAAPIVLPPQACALAIGAITDTVVPLPDAAADQNNWQVSSVVTVTLSCDHRVVDGAVGAQWLAALKAHIEEPITMIL